MPDLEYWFSGVALITVISFAISTGLALYSLRKDTKRSLFNGLIWGPVVFLAFLWWHTASREEAMDKPKKDYVYLIPFGVNGGEILFRTQSTGPLETVEAVAIRTSEYYDDSKSKDVRSFLLHMVKEGLHGSHFRLPPGDWTIDLDQIHQNGQVRQRIAVVICGDGIKYHSEVTRKHDNKLIVPPPTGHPSAPRPPFPTDCP